MICHTASVGASGADLAFVFSLADAADRVSTSYFRSEAIRTTTKGDGTPVSQVDLAVEEAMLEMVRAERPDDGVVGEEVGSHPGSSSRRWFFDGIDGTHNYAAGRPGWGTIIALDVAGEVAVGVVSAPLFGRRWWAERGGGAWGAPCSADGSFDSGAATPLRCTAHASLDDASLIVTPFEGALLGWRDEVPRRFVPPPSPRSQCFAIDAVMVAAGELDAAIILLGGVWDFAATSLMLAEAGGVFRDVWGGERLDTGSGVFANSALTGPLLDVLATMRPTEPDRPQLAKTVSTPIGGEDDGGEDEWRRFGIRSLPSMSARTRVEHAPPMVLDIVDERVAHLASPFVGVTTDGVVRVGLRTLGGPKVRTRAIVDAARVPAGAGTRPADTGHVPDRRHRVAHVDQRAHEPFPPRPPAGGSGAAGSRPGARHRARNAVGARVSTRRVRSCGSTDCWRS